MTAHFRSRFRVGARASIAATRALALAAAFVAGAGADQADPRLDALFAALRGAASVEAAAVHERAITAIWLESGRDDVDALMMEADEAMNGGDLDRAGALFDIVVSLAPRFAEGWSRRGAVSYLRGRNARALTDIDRALALEPRHFGAWFGRGLLLFESDDPAGALAAFERTLELHPRSVNGRAYVDELRKRLQ